MPINTTDLMQNIYDLFTGIYATTNRSGVTLGFEPFGVPVSTTMFKLNQTDTGFLPALAVERLSEMAGAVLELHGSTVQRSNRTVEAVTEMMLQQSMAVTPEVMAALGAAKNSDGQRFGGTLASLEGAFQYHPVYASPVDWYDPAALVWTPHTVGQAAAQSSGPPPGAPPPPPRPVLSTPPIWRVLPTEMRPTLQVSAPRAAALMSMVQTRPNQIATMTMRPQMAMMGRRSVLAADAPPVASPPVAFPAATSLAFRPLMVAQVAAQVTASTTPQTVNTDSLNISFDHCIVTLNRPWFPQVFTMLRNWYVPGYARGEISDGAADSGLMPLLASGFVAIRNLRIAAKWSQQDLVAVQSSASFGPFCLVGRSFDAASGTLSAPGMQIIGWFCDALPVLPPMSDPALAASVKPVAAPPSTDTAVAATPSVDTPPPAADPASLVAHAVAGAAP